MKGTNGKKNEYKIWMGNSLNKDIQMANRQAGHIKGMALIQE